MKREETFFSKIYDIRDSFFSLVLSSLTKRELVPLEIQIKIIYLGRGKFNLRINSLVWGPFSKKTARNFLFFYSNDFPQRKKVKTIVCHYLEIFEGHRHSIQLLTLKINKLSLFSRETFLAFA